MAQKEFFTFSHKKPPRRLILLIESAETSCVISGGVNLSSKHEDIDQGSLYCQSVCCQSYLSLILSFLLLFDFHYSSTI